MGILGVDIVQLSKTNIFVFIGICVVYVINAIFIERFANRLGYKYSVLAYIPYPGFMDSVFINSMNKVAPIFLSERVVMIICLGANITMLSFIPMLGILFTFIGWVCTIITDALTVLQLYTFCKKFDRPFILCTLCILLMLSGIGSLVAIMILTHNLQLADEI